jgi:hypothetical protein
VLGLGLIWVDNSFDQLFQLRKFLLVQGIAVGNVLNHSNGVYRLQIGSPSSVLSAAKMLVGFCFKKRKELEAVISYYENRISGSAVLSIFNEQVRRGIRLGKIRPLTPLPRYRDGLYEVARARGLKGAEAANAKKRLKKELQRAGTRRT